MSDIFAQSKDDSGDFIVCSIIQRRFISVASLVLWLLSCSVLLAKPVTVEHARRAADTFLRARATPQEVGLMMASVRVERKAPAVVLSHTGIKEICADDGTVLAYVTELEPQGFIATSADTNIAPIIAYSFESNFLMDQDENNILYHMLKTDMELRLKALPKCDQSKILKNNILWNNYSTGNLEYLEDTHFQQWPEKGTTSTGGWVETTWNQVNDCCPLDPKTGTRCWAGCVATAMAQIINYHKHIGNSCFGDADEYTTESGIKIDANSTTYNFPSFEQLNNNLDTIRDKYLGGIDLNNTDIAALHFACGIATKMNYSASGSYTSLDNNVFLNKFSFYSADLIGGSTVELYDKLKENMINQLPAILSIFREDYSAGHAIICDGYNTNNEYHLNYGMGIYGWIGWYQLPIGMPAGYKIIDPVVLNVQPYQPSIDFNPDLVFFYSDPNQKSNPESVSIQNTTAEEILIASISSSDGFMIARSNGNYSNHIESFYLSAGQTETITVIFCPGEEGSYDGVIEVNYGKANVKNIILEGRSFSGGTKIIPGGISGTWSEKDSPYYILGDIQVDPNHSLIIEPGVKVIFLRHNGITIGKNARLIAVGDKNNWIEFTAFDNRTGWKGLRFLQSGDDDILEYCSIRDSTDGGIYCKGVYCDENTCDCSPSINNCKIINNIGKGIHLLFASPFITNTLIANNNTVLGYRLGGGICSGYISNPKIANCTIVANKGGGIYLFKQKGEDMFNTIVWGNGDYQIKEVAPISTMRVSFCNIEGGYPGDGNLNMDPCFVCPSTGIGADFDGLAADWHLQANSPCINAGDPNYLDSVNNVDIDGDPRIIGDRIDIGSDEYNYVEASDLNKDGAVDYKDFSILGYYWMDHVCLAPDWCQGSDFNRTGRVDRNDLLIFAECWLEGVKP